MQEMEDVQHPATLPKKFGDNPVPLEFICGLFGMDWKESCPALSITDMGDSETAIKALVILTEEVENIVNNGNVPLDKIHDVSRKVMLRQCGYERRKEVLEKEISNLRYHTESKHTGLWCSFDQLLYPLWTLDDCLIQPYNTLAKILSRLEGMKKLKIFEMDPAEKLRELNHIKNALEKIQHEQSGEFYRTCIDATAIKGRETCIDLLHRCTDLLHQIIQEVDDELTPTLIKLSKLVANLLCFRKSLEIRKPVDKNNNNMKQLYFYQKEARSIDNERVDGSFRGKNGGIPGGQAVLAEYLETAYDLIHECLILQSSERLHEKNQDVSMYDFVTWLMRKLTTYFKIGEFKTNSAYETFLNFFSQVIYTFQKAAEYIKSQIRAISIQCLPFIEKKLTPVDTSLTQIEADLYGIITKLKRIRDRGSKNLIRKFRMERSEFRTFNENILLPALEKDERKLDCIKNSHITAEKYFNFGEFAVEDIFILMNILDECYLLLMELHDDAILPK